MELPKLVQDIVDACRACSAYTRAAPHDVATSRLPAHFNDVAQHGLLVVTWIHGTCCEEGSLATYVGHLHTIDISYDCYG